jgi:ferritin heavy chain
MTELRCRQNWSQECEKALNQHINKEYQASYQYHCLSTYFDRDDIGYPQLVKYFNNASLEEREHADKLMKYQNMRGGKVELFTIPNLSSDFNKENNVFNAFSHALQLEKNVNQSLLDLHKVASDNNDPQFSDYIEGEFLKEQVEAISELSKMITHLERLGNDKHGIWEFCNGLESN